MYLKTVSKTVLRKRRAGSLAAFMLFVSSSYMCAQGSQPSACNMDSSGFCTPGTVEAAPLLSPALQNEGPSASIPSLQSKLQVEFGSDLLRIDAENATLRDTLKAVSARTGAEIQFPAGALEERIFAHLGPGSPREVVSRLLNGVPFNYVILSSASDPSGITRLILSRASVDRESAASGAPFLPVPDPAATQLYGASFAVDPNSPVADPIPNETPGVSAATPVANWIHTDGPKLSGEYLDQMQKMQIQQEQQQFAQQEQQQRQQQQQPQQPQQNATQQ